MVDSLGWDVKTYIYTEANKRLLQNTYKNNQNV